MEGENEKACTNCGSPVKEGASFCTSCGAAQAAPGEAAAAAAPPPVPPPGPEAAPQPPGVAAPPPMAPPAAEAGAPGAPMPGAAPMAPPKRSKAPMVIGIIGGVLVLCGIVVLVLWLTVWKDGGSGSGSATPIALAEKYIEAVEKGDVDAYIACFEPDFFNVEDVPFIEDFDPKEFINMTFEMADFGFEDVSLEVESETSDRATVVTTGGTATVSFIGVAEEVDLVDDPLEFKMVKKDGKWYMVDDPMATIMSGGVDLDGMDLDNLDELVPEDLQDLENLIPEDLNIEDFENLIPEELNIEDMSPEELEQMLEDLEQLMQDMPLEENSGV